MKDVQLDDVVWVEAPDWAEDLAERMAVPLHRYGVKPSWRNAATDKAGMVVVGDSLLVELSPQSLQGVLAHEFGHTRFAGSQYARWSLVLQAAVWMDFAKRLSNVNPLLIWYCRRGLLQVLNLMMWPVRWLEEYGSDAIAAEHVGWSKMVATLVDLGRVSGSFDTDGLDHPSIRKRIIAVLLGASAAPSHESS